ncbi:unnamed protein product [Linum tenue]|uniref:Uncharacterized protein n=1 Tax=Linum tenue TaxID=586396 RepID=A0AAV0IQ20_9ROSI|nr:unnamed protein product [Linum tenue]CAI0398858.1 unnamed protein product [Linum tenue]
MDSGRTGV